MMLRLIYICLLSCTAIVFSQGPCGGRLCMEYATGKFKWDNDVYTFIQTAAYDFMIEVSFTPIASSETLTELVIKHDKEVLASGDGKTFGVVRTNVRSISGRYYADYTEENTYKFYLMSMNKRYASGVYIIKAYYKLTNQTDQLFEEFRFNFGLKVNGGLSTWSTFSPCSKPCGNGEIIRRRSCTNPKPEYGGYDCQHLGRSIERFPCRVKECGTWTRENQLSRNLYTTFANNPSVRNMLEFGYHCFLTPSSNINDVNRFFISLGKGSRKLLRNIYLLTRNSIQVFLHCSVEPCEEENCTGTQFMSVEFEKGKGNLVDMSISVDFEKSGYGK